MKQQKLFSSKMNQDGPETHPIRVYTPDPKGFRKVFQINSLPRNL